MSHLPAEALTYETVVAEYFLGLRGAGLMLSPLDLDLVRAWQRRGVPVAVVCRGLRRVVEDARRDPPPGAAPPRSIRACRLAVEDEWRGYREGRVGDAPPPPAPAALASARLAVARTLLDRAGLSASGALREAYRAAWHGLAGARAEDLEQVERALVEADAALVRAWLAALPRPERAALGPRCRLRAGARPPWTRPTAYRAALRAHLVDAARAAGLLCLRGSV